MRLIQLSPMVVSSGGFGDGCLNIVFDERWGLENRQWGRHDRRLLGDVSRFQRAHAIFQFASGGEAVERRSRKGLPAAGHALQEALALFTL